MTDNEIIKALEEWIKALKDDYKRLQALDAPMDCFEESHTDNIRILSNALDLINRQKAEIERLEGLANHHRELINELNKGIAEAKAEAVKEFEERAIKNICEKVYAPTPVQSCIVEKCNQVIIEIAKEMAGEG